MGDAKVRRPSEAAVNKALLAVLGCCPRHHDPIFEEKFQAAVDAITARGDLNREYWDIPREMVEARLRRLVRIDKPEWVIFLQDETDESLKKLDPNSN